MSQRRLAIDSWEALFRAQVHVMRRISADFPIGGVSLSEYDVLFTLSKQPGQRARLREITRLVLLSQPSVSRMVDRLAGRGLVEKLQDQSDGRGTIVAMTPLGRERYREAAVKHAEHIATIMRSALTDEEMATLQRISSKLHVEGTP